MFKLNIRETLANYKRVLSVARKPDKNEIFAAARICAIGMAVVGLIGFVIYLVAVMVNL